MKNNKKIIEKVYKCLRLSESGNPNEAALALRQATSLMKKYGISDAQILAAEVTEGATHAGERYNPPFWALALANLVANAFECRNLITRRYGQRPEFRFIGLGFKTEVATYSYTVLHRYLERAIEDFELSLGSHSSAADSKHRVEVFAQAWLFRVGRTVSEFIGENADKEIIDQYINDKYGETVELAGQPVETNHADYDDILSGMRAADEVALYRSVGRFAETQLLQHKRAS
ncbi:MAG: DUF2786 domain-containing protein [Gammaproteobacteria bacterium]|nr:DUF2786 domain-containing protein [Gammaproteobacteria bacterium]